MTDLVLLAPDRLRAGETELSCVIGRGGLNPDKREGDGATPVGRYRLDGVLYRPDRVAPPDTLLACRPLTPDDGWCDAPDAADYNRWVRLPFGPSHERLWRDDGLYDVIVITSHNADPVVPGAGSAIFVHVWAADRGPTEGCVACDRAALLTFLATADPDSHLDTRPAWGALNR